MCLTLCDPVDCSLPAFSVHGILQARILEWVAIPFPRGSSRSRDWTWVSCIAGRFFTTWATQGNRWSLFQFCKSWYKLFINYMGILTCDSAFHWCFNNQTATSWSGFMNSIVKNIICCMSFIFNTVQYKAELCESEDVDDVGNMKWGTICMSYMVC